MNENDRKIFMKLQDISEGNVSEDLLKISIITIMRMMKAYYEKPVILLLNEYDEVICYGISFYKKRCVVKKQMRK